MEYRNLDLFLGIPVSFKFDAKDETGLPISLSGTTLKFEVYDASNLFVFTKSATNSDTVDLTTGDTSSLKEDRYSYRAVLTNTSSTLPIAELNQGFIYANGPVFATASTPNNNVVTLPDGAIYPLGPITIVFDSWYAPASFFRFIASGTGAATMDGKKIDGSITGNISTMVVTGSSGTLWIPDLTGYTEFRIHSVSSGISIQYLP